MTCSPLEGFLDKSGPNLLLRTVIVKEWISLELLCMEGSLAQRNTGSIGPRLDFTDLEK